MGLGQDNPIWNEIGDALQVPRYTQEASRLKMKC